MGAFLETTAYEKNILEKCIQGANSLELGFHSKLNFKCINSDHSLVNEGLHFTTEIY